MLTNRVNLLNKVMIGAKMSKGLLSLPIRGHVIAGPPGDDENPVRFVFQFSRENTIIPVKARIGESLLEVAHNNNVELEGACESSLACSTCHLILDDAIFEMLDEPVEEEEDMLDLAYGLRHTSRLGC